MRKPTPALAVSLVALFFSLTGAGIAASHYLITSVSQIKPSVRAALRGKVGPQGLAGPQGTAGDSGSQGAQGPQGDPGSRGPAGPSMLDSTYTVVSATAHLTTSAPQGGETVECNPQDNLVAGGFQNVSGTDITTDAPWPNRLPLADTPGHNAWIVQGTLAPGSTTGTFNAVALCAPAS